MPDFYLISSGALFHEDTYPSCGSKSKVPSGWDSGRQAAAHSSMRAMKCPCAGKLCLLGLILFQIGCCYSSSGTWEEDPNNWKRAWGYSKPSDIEMIHSWYWRSPHFTREESYFFQFRWHEKLFQTFMEMKNLRRVHGKESWPQYCFDKPQWFTPGLPQAYEMWTCEPPANCWLFRNRETKEMFIYACQL
jgi:hypothetical protein